MNTSVFQVPTEIQKRSMVFMLQDVIIVLVPKHHPDWILGDVQNFEYDLQESLVGPHLLWYSLI
jgi:flagellar biosynthesis protein FliQ